LAGVLLFWKWLAKGFTLFKEGFLSKNFNGASKGGLIKNGRITK